MNPRQRRGALLMGVAVVGAVAVFVSVFGYVAEVRRDVGPKVTVLELTTEVSAFEPLPAGSFAEVQIPEKYVPDGALSSEEVLSLVPSTDLEPGTVLQEGLLVPPPQLGPDEQQVAINVDAATGVAGQVGPGSVVDIYATFAGTGEATSDVTRNCSMLLIRDAPVLVVSGIRDEADQDAQGGAITNEVITVTFALTRALSRQLVYASSFAEEIWLGLNSTQTTGEATTGAVGGRGSVSPEPGVCELPPGLSFPGGA